MNELERIWVYLSASPLLWLAATLLAWQAGLVVFERTGRRAWANPVMVAVVILGTLLLVTGTPYSRFFDGAQFVHFLLGPATVALAVPLWRHRERVVSVGLPMGAALAAGCVTAILSAGVTAKLLGAEPSSTASLLPKSATSPIAMAVAERLGGIPSLAAALVIVTGIFVAVAGPPLLRLLGVNDLRAMGTAMGVAGHGIGTATAFQVHELAGTFSGIAMALNGFLTALLAPLLAALFLP